MSWFNFWQSLFRAVADTHSAPSSGTVREEMLFHFRELVNENVTKGATFDAAWEQAEQQFGSLGKYENECHALQLQQSLHWGMTAFAVLSLILIGAGWSQFAAAKLQLGDDLLFVKNELAALRNEQDRLAAKTLQVVSERIQPADCDLVGVVVDGDEQPLRDAIVLVILKTWPYGQYQQDNFSRMTDADGKFVLPKLIPGSSRYAVEVTAIKQGFAFHSFFHLKQTPEEKPELITLQLKPAPPLTLVVRDHNGEPIPNAQVMPLSRETPFGDKHVIYFQGSAPVLGTTDAKGQLPFGYFQPGDTAEIYVQLPGQGWNRHEFEVSPDDRIVDLGSTAVVVN